MKIYIKYDHNITGRAVVKEQMDKLNIGYEMKAMGEFSIMPEEEKLKELKENLNRYGIELINDPRCQLIQKIKDTICNMIEQDKLPLSKISCYIGEQLEMNYSYISTLFSQYTYTSIENFIILQKIERTKRLLLQEYSLTEISYKLNYSSVAHLSGQFKKATGISPSLFKKIVKKRKEITKYN